MKLAALLSIFISWGVHATTITENFTSRADFESGTAVWDQALGAVFSVFDVTDYEAPGTPLPQDVGDGSDGSFDDSVYAAFSVGGNVAGNIIRLDTGAHPVLNVTRFTLDAGWTLQPVGSNPLIIKSLSYVQIIGTIDCSGGDGADAAGASGGSGGVGRCGGRAGGNGGDATNNGQKGGDASAPTVTGGAGGAGAHPEGGGGGSWDDNPAPAGPNAGNFFADPAFTTVAGGSGGGGGAGDATTGGGGGGGGAGVVIIHAVGDISFGASPTSVTGYILATGGSGGNPSGTGGPGGGGAGGSVWVTSANNVNWYNTDPNTVNASEGTGGTGGDSGGTGRNFFTYNGVNGTDSYTPAIEFPAAEGLISYETSAQFVITKSFDLASNSATVNSLSLIPASATDFNLQVAGSSDNFVSDNTGFTTNLALLAGKRYLKMKINVNTSNAAAPQQVTSAQIDVTIPPPPPPPPPLNDFTFTGTGCGRVDHAGNGSLLFFLTPILLLLFKRRRATRCTP